MRARTPPVGGARVAWSYLAGILAAVLLGLVISIVYYVEASVCAVDDFTCTIAVFTGSAVAGGVLFTALGAALFRLGWEWWLVVAAAIFAMPTALDALGAGGWAVVALAPALAALATLHGPSRPRWRPWVVAVTCAAVIVAAVLTTLFLG